jgi:hypothetical protein
MRKLTIVALLLLTLTGCAQLNWVLGIDDKGDVVNEAAPMRYLAAVISSLGPLGVLGSGLLTTLGGTYIAHKRSDNRLTAVVSGVQKTRDALSAEDSAVIKEQLKKHIPNKYHGAIKRIKDAL